MFSFKIIFLAMASMANSQPLVFGQAGHRSNCRDVLEFSIEEVGGRVICKIVSPAFGGSGYISRQVTKFGSRDSRICFYLGKESDPGRLSVVTFRNVKSIDYPTGLNAHLLFRDPASDIDIDVDMLECREM